MGSSTSKKVNIDEIIQINNDPIKIRYPPQNPNPIHKPQNQIFEKKKVNEDEDELKKFEIFVHEINNNKYINLNRNQINKVELMEINKEINNEFNFPNLIKDDFDNAKACIFCCNLNESDQNSLNKLEWNKDKINQEETNKSKLIDLIKRNRNDLLKLIENN